MATDTEDDLDFFAGETEADLRQQVAWLGEHAGLDDAFFARMLRVGEDDLRAWREGTGRLDVAILGDLARFWDTMLHLLSYTNNDYTRLRALLSHPVAPPRPDQRVPDGFLPPWAGTTLRAYLEARGRDAFGPVDEWVTSFKFGRRY